MPDSVAVGHSIVSFDGGGSIARVVETLQNVGGDRSDFADVDLSALELNRAELMRSNSAVLNNRVHYRETDS